MLVIPLQSFKKSALAFSGRKRMVARHESRYSSGAPKRGEFKMNNKKNYPHLPQEENRLRELCYEKLHAAYGESLPPEGKDRLDKELTAIAGSDMSGVMGCAV